MSLDDLKGFDEEAERRRRQREAIRLALAEDREDHLSNRDRREMLDQAEKDEIIQRMGLQLQSPIPGEDIPEEFLEFIANLKPSSEEHGELIDILTEATDLGGRNEDVTGGDDKVPQRHHTLPPYIPIKAKDPTTNLWQDYCVLGYEKSGSSIASFSSGTGTGGGSSPSKLAITRYKDKWIGWHCSEEPQSMFYDTLDISLISNEGYRKIPPKMVASVIPKSMKVVSATPSAPARISSVIYYSEGLKEWIVQVKTRPCLFKPSPLKATIRYGGIRRNSSPRWERFSEQIKLLNDMFWSQARL